MFIRVMYFIAKDAVSSVLVTFINTTNHIILMQNRIVQAINSLPPSGIALHGTTMKNANLVSKSFLQFPAYHTLIPNPKNCVCDEIKQMSEDVFLSKSIGSTLIASSFSISRMYNSNDLPAIIIFAHNKFSPQCDFNFLGCDAHTPVLRQTLKYGSRRYSSFGIDSSIIDGKFTRAIVHLSKDELYNIKMKYQNDNFMYNKLIRDILVVKTLFAIEKISLNLTSQDIIYV